MADLRVIDKFSGEVIGVVPIADAPAVDRTVRAAHAAFGDWQERPAHERAGILRRVADLIDGRKEQFAATIARESGKAWKHALAEVTRSVETFTFSSEEARRIHGETIPMDASVAGENRIGFYLRFPIGVIAAITPFNFPLNLVAHKAGPAIAAGNTIVLKPAEETPLTAELMRGVFAESGLPDNVLSLVHGDGPTTGEALVTHPIPAKVSFTGSPPVGRRITQLAGLKRLTLELGNNSGTMVEPDADLSQAVPRCVMSAFSNAGQICISLQRLYVHEAVADAFVAEFVRQTDALKVGNPLEHDTDVGPLVSDEAAERAAQWIADAVSQGARLLTGGQRSGRIVRPAVLTDTRPDMAVMCQEAFAPLVSIVRYRTFDEGLRLLADTPYGLQAGIYTRDLGKAFEAVRRLDMGGVMINDTSIFRVDHMPYGGNRLSGIGREGVRFAVEDMTSLRTVVFNLR